MRPNTLIFLVLNAVFITTTLGAANSQRRRHDPQYNNSTTPTSSRSSASAAFLNNQPTTSGILEKLSQQISSLSSNDEQQLKRLEALEYRLTRTDATNHEKLDAVKDQIKEMSQRIQNIDWLSSKNDATLSEIMNELGIIRRALEGREGMRKRSSDDQSMNASDPDDSDKLTAIATLLASTRAAVHKLEREFDFIGLNLTQLLMITREIYQRQHNLPTKQFLNGAISTLRQQPIYGLMQGYNGNNNFYPPVGYDSSFRREIAPADCTQVQTSGIHRIHLTDTILRGGAPNNVDSFFALCDTETENGGWLVIQNRQDGSVNFNRNWLEYKFGFGNIAGEFFIGLEKLHEITRRTLHELLVVLEDFDGERKFAKYKTFAIAGEPQDYALNVLGEYEGTAGDSLTYSASYKFSTFDNDNDGWVEGNCAQAHTGAWWYNACEMSNLNGQYLKGVVLDSHQFQGIYWNTFRGPLYSLKSVKMLIRPVDRVLMPDLN